MNEQMHVSDINFDRAFADELPVTEQRRLHAHLNECARCRERQRLLAEDRAAFLSEVPSFREYSAKHGAATPVTRRAPRQPGRAAKASLWMSLSAATALAASFLLMTDRVAMPSALDTRIKGSAQLGFYIKHGSKVSRGRPDQVVHPGDVLRFTYSSPEPTYFALLGRDEHTATLFYPTSNEAAALPKGTDLPLDFGIEIDAQLGQEYIYALFCSKPVALTPVVPALERSSELVPPESCVVRELQLQKVVP